jgi:uncharacterized protein (TIGR00255 family)
MTGFGRAVAEAEGITIWAEIASLNHRYLDIGLRLPPQISGFDNDIRKLVQSRIERGRVNVSLTAEGDLPESNQLEFNQNLAQQYLDGARAFALRANLKDDLSATSLLRITPLWTMRTPHPDETARLRDLALDALTGAIEQLLEMRRAEGVNIWADISSRLQQVEAISAEIASGAEAIVEDYRERLKQRIASILPQETELDEQRLLTEIAIFADKADISEELTRMQSHIQQFVSLADKGSNVGRRLDFLLQEMFREITTIGSKARAAQVSHAVVDVKGLLEKMREQVQNIE